MKQDNKKAKSAILIFILLVLITGLVVTAIWSNRVYIKTKNLLSLMEGLKQIQLENIRQDDLARLVDMAEYFDLSIEDIRTDVQPLFPFLGRLGFIPWAGQYAVTIEPLFEYASSISRASILLGNTFLPLFEKSRDVSLKTMPQVLGNFLLENQKDFSNAEILLDNAKEARKKIDPLLFPEKYQDELLLLDGVLENYPLFFNALDSVPRLLGAEEPITYLLLVQNNDEIRASGGYISAFGLLQLKDGRIMALKIQDSSELEYVKEIREAPLPMKKIMFAHYLLARDANWSPDYPSAAKLTQEMYALTTGFETDGVIAFDQQLIVDFLDFSGPLQIPGENGLIDAANVEEKMIEFKQTAVDERRSKERKDFLSEMAPYLIKKMFEIEDTERVVELGKLVQEAIQKGHLLVFFNDPIPQELLSSLKLDNSVSPGDGDYLMVVDSNIGIGKMDLYIDRSVEYSVDLTDINYPRGEILLRYTHTQPGDDPCHQGLLEDYPNYYTPRCYWDYWRVLTPADTEFSRIEFEPVPDEYFMAEGIWENKSDIAEGENGTSMAGGLMVVPQMDEKEVRLSTELPARILQSKEDGNLRYTLCVQKQPGLKELHLTLKVTLPEGYQLLDQSSQWNYLKVENTVQWSGAIDRTTDFSLEFEIIE